VFFDLKDVWSLFGAHVSFSLFYGSDQVISLFTCILSGLPTSSPTVQVLRLASMYFLLVGCLFQRDPAILAPTMLLLYCQQHLVSRRKQLLHDTITLSIWCLRVPTCPWTRNSSNLVPQILDGHNVSNLSIVLRQMLISIVLFFVGDLSLWMYVPCILGWMHVRGSKIFYLHCISKSEHVCTHVATLA
jgi:hypothetical protein